MPLLQSFPECRSSLSRSSTRIKTPRGHSNVSLPAKDLPSLLHNQVGHLRHEVAGRVPPKDRKNIHFVLLAEKEILIRSGQALLQGDFHFPPQFFHPRDIEKLPGGAIGF